MVPGDGYVVLFYLTPKDRGTGGRFYGPFFHLISKMVLNVESVGISMTIPGEREFKMVLN